MKNNPVTLAGKPVRELGKFSRKLTQEEKEEVYVLIGTPEDIQEEIVECLIQHGFYHYICIDSKKMAYLMEMYFEKNTEFVSLHTLKKGREESSLQVFLAKFHKDKVLKNIVNYPKWINSLQVGSALTELRIGEYCDNIGDNISAKNANYCELTGLYWIWKQLKKSETVMKQKRFEADYYGLFHYRRILDITAEDLLRLKENNVDVILPYPTLHEPDMREHHVRYIKEMDWEVMLNVLSELQPKYMEVLPELLSQPYFYNYNIVIAKETIIKEYCEWLFPILQRVEELSEPKGCERYDRYIGYLGENLLTIYFLYHKMDFKICHVNCLMLK